MLTLGIETSCDETAVAIYDSGKGIVGESVFSQIDMHAEYGGVVPELASRDHCLKIISVLEEALGKGNIKDIDQIAYTSGPGLLGALLVCESFAHGLAAGLGVPTIPVHHLEAHLMAPALDFDDINDLDINHSSNKNIDQKTNLLDCHQKSKKYLSKKCNIM